MRLTHRLRRTTSIMAAAIALIVPLAVAGPAHATAPSGPICGTASYSSLSDLRTYNYIGAGPITDGNTILRYWLVEIPRAATGGPNAYSESYVAHCGPTGLLSYDEPAATGYLSSDPQCAAPSDFTVGTVHWYYVGQRTTYIQVLPHLLVPHLMRYWELLDVSKGPWLALSSVVAEC